MIYSESCGRSKADAKSGNQKGIRLVSHIINSLPSRLHVPELPNPPKDIFDATLRI